eukprot:tig00020830_g14389.t1
MPDGAGGVQLAGAGAPPVAMALMESPRALALGLSKSASAAGADGSRAPKTPDRELENFGFLCEEVHLSSRLLRIASRERTILDLGRILREARERRRGEPASGSAWGAGDPEAAGPSAAGSFEFEDPESDGSLSSSEDELHPEGFLPPAAPRPPQRAPRPQARHHAGPPAGSCEFIAMEIRRLESIQAAEAGEVLARSGSRAGWRMRGPLARLHRLRLAIAEEPAYSWEEAGENATEGDEKKSARQQAADAFFVELLQSVTGQGRCWRIANRELAIEDELQSDSEPAPKRAPAAGYRMPKSPKPLPPSESGSDSEESDAGSRSVASAYSEARRRAEEALARRGEGAGAREELLLQGGDSAVIASILGAEEAREREQEQRREAEELRGLLEAALRERDKAEARAREAEERRGDCAGPGAPAPSPSPKSGEELEAEAEEKVPAPAPSRERAAEALAEAQAAGAAATASMPGPSPPRPRARRDSSPASSSPPVAIELAVVQPAAGGGAGDGSSASSAAEVVPLVRRLPRLRSGQAGGPAPGAPQAPARLGFALAPCNWPRPGPGCCSSLWGTNY